MVEVKHNKTQEFTLLRVNQALIPIEKLKVSSNIKKYVCAQSVNKNNINAEFKNNTRILIKKWKFNMSKTTPGQPNSGYPLFRRQD
jgi:hypothetical protein